MSKDKRVHINTSAYILLVIASLALLAFGLAGLILYRPESPAQVTVTDSESITILVGNAPASTPPASITITPTVNTP